MKKDNWEIKKLGEVCEVINGYAFKSRKYIDYGIRIIRITNVQKGAIIDNEPKFYPISEKDNISRYLLRENDLLISLTGNIGRVGILPKELLPAALNQRVGCFRLRNSNLTLKFLFYLLNSDTFENKCMNAAKGVAQKNLSVEWLKQYQILMPPLSVQKAIVKELDTLHRIKELQEQQLAEYDTLAQATFHSMFGDPIENEKGWEVKKMGEVCEITSSKRIFAKEYQESGIPFYRSKEIIEKSKKLPVSLELFISKERYLEIKTSFGTPKIGDILMTAVGTIGEIWVVDTDDSFYFKDGNILWLKISKSGNSIFFKYSLSILVSEYKKRMSIGSAYNALTIVNLKNMQSILPPISLQNQFAERIEKIEAQKELVKQSIAETQTLIDYTMDKYFG